MKRVRREEGEQETDGRPAEKKARLHHDPWWDVGNGELHRAIRDRVSRALGVSSGLAGMVAQFAGVETGLRLVSANLSFDINFAVTPSQMTWEQPGRLAVNT